MLLSTHILPEVTLICQRVAIINHGRLLAIDSPAGLQRASEQTNRVTLRVTAPAAAVRDALLSVDGVPAVDIRAEPGRAPACSTVECQVDARDGVEAAIARAVAGRWDLHRLERQQPTLENIFLRYVERGPGERGGGMNGMLAVYRKELLTYFRSPIAYFVVAVFLLGTGYFFLYNIFLTGDATMDETFQNMGILLLTLAPVISMRLFAAEYSGRTMELLMTLPLTPWQIVLGKFLGAVTILLLMTAGTMHRPDPALPVRQPRDHDDPVRLHRLRAARHGLPRGRPVLLGADAEPDRRRADHGPGAARASGSSATCRPSRPRRACAACSATCRSRCTSPISSRASCAAKRWFST